MDIATHWVSEINDSIIQPIDLLIEHRHQGAAVILILAGIDAMANVNRVNLEVSTANDFRAWVEAYFHIEGQTEITPDEWWEARNAIVHTFGAYSLAHRRGQRVRILGWMCCGFIPPVRYNAAIHPEMAMVDVLAMRNAFVQGVNRFLTETLNDRTRRDLIISRLDEFLRHYQYRN